MSECCSQNARHIKSTALQALIYHTASDVNNGNRMNNFKGANKVVISEITSLSSDWRN